MGEKRFDPGRAFYGEGPLPWDCEAAASAKIIHHFGGTTGMRGQADGGGGELGPAAQQMAGWEGFVHERRGDRTISFDGGADQRRCAPGAEFTPGRFQWLISRHS